MAWGIAEVIVVATIGIFEANAVQFGMDQMMEASSAQLSSFIHWYFWSMHLGQQLFFFGVIVLGITIHATKLHHGDHITDTLVMNTFLLVIVLVWMICVALGAFVLHNEKKFLYIAKTGINPFKQAWNVLSFAWKNKYPLNRSAFTYCEDYVPSRLDLGKQQYGGPFTTEEVEDIKTFLRLLALLVTLFGYHVAGDGFAIAQHLEKYSCPSLTVWSLIVCNPMSLSIMVALVGIPLVQWLPRVDRLLPEYAEKNGIWNVHLGHSRFSLHPSCSSATF